MNRWEAFTRIMEMGYRSKRPLSAVLAIAIIVMGTVAMAAIPVAAALWLR